MRLGWVGFHVEGVEALRALLEEHAPVQAVLTLEPALAARRSGAADYEPLCEAHGVPLHFIRDINDARSLVMLRELSLDLAFVVGWTQLVGAEALRLVPRGMIGAHASLLPACRGRAPVNWALIRGMSQTGNSLIWLSERADRGDIIDQRAMPITPYDTCATIYAKVAASNKEMILGVLPRLLNGERPGWAQPAGDERDLPRRRPEDGLVEWSRPNTEIYDFIRALTRPYPGAMSWLDGRSYRLWEAALLPDVCATDGQPGEILGPVVSPRSEACGLAVRCRPGSVVLLEIADSEGRILKGTSLSDLHWAGKRWSSTAH